MAKYSFEFKKDAVQAYLNGEGSYASLAKKFGMPPGRDIRKWVKAYKTFGDDGLRRSRRNQKYTFDFKMSVVELYLSSEISYQGLALSVGITNPATITKWVNDFKIAGSDALRTKKKGRKKALDTSRKKQNPNTIETVPADFTAEYVKQLEDKLLKLRIENAYLKELRRLRLEEETLLKKQRGSFTASEENSN